MSFTDETDDRRGGGPGLDLRYWLWVLRRRFWVFAVVAALLAGAGLGAALVLPPVYEARATLLVESQQIPADLVRSTVATPASEQIEVIRQRLLARDTLLELAERHRVFPNAAEMTASERANAMRAAITFSQRTLGDTRAARTGGTVAIALSIGFQSASGATSAAVVNDLVTRVLRQSAELRRARAGVTSTYFRQEVAQLGTELARAEARIVAFQEANRDSLPESLNYRRSQLDLVLERLQRFELARVELEQERASLESVVEAGRAATPEAALSEDERALLALRRTLSQRRTILSDSHPEIRELGLRIRALELALEAGAADGSGGAAASATSGLDPAMREIVRRLGLVEARLAFNAQSIAEAQAQRDALERSLLDTPNVQMELAGLQRAYEHVEVRYRTALAKLAEAEAGEQLEDRQQGERLEVIEQATVPEDPIRPNRRRLAIMGAGGGLGAGLGLVVLLEMMSGVVRRPEDLVRIGREPAAVIPYIATAGERRRLWAGRILGVAAILGGVSAALWALHVHYLPLETIADKVTAASGLDGALELVRRRFGL